MLTERQVRSLLERCEAASCCRLEKIRGNLLGRNPTPFIWELVVLDALQAMATVEYESPTDSGKTPDFWIPRLVSQPLRAEAAYVEDRFSENEKRRRALIARLAKELRSRGMPAGSIGWEILGEQTPAGPKQILPKEHELKRFFASPPLQDFLRSLVARPELALTCDLLPHGYSLRLFYIPKGSARPLVSGHSLVADAPTAVEEHIVFRTLVAKGRKAKKAQLNEPYLVCIGSEGSPSMTGGHSARVITRERAASEAFRKYPVLSAAVLVPIEYLHPDHPSRTARPILLVNPVAHRPIASEDLETLIALDFNRWEYGPSWNEWSRAPPGVARRKRIGGSMTVKGGSKPDHERVELLAKFVAQLLAGEIGAADLNEEYRMGPKHGFPNPFQRLLSDNRSIVDVEFFAGDPTRRQPPKIAFEYGPPEEPILQHKKGQR